MDQSVWVLSQQGPDWGNFHGRVIVECALPLPDSPQGRGDTSPNKSLDV